MTRDAAIEVEAALIDMFPALTNIAPGRDSQQRGPANAKQLDDRHRAEVLVEDPEIKLMYIKIRQTTADAKGL